MASPTTRKFSSRGTPMAIACGAVIVAALGGMYFMRQDVKGKEGQASPYEHQGRGIRGTDIAMTSADVSATVSVPKPRHERLEGAHHDHPKS